MEVDLINIVGLTFTDFVCLKKSQPPTCGHGHFRLKIVLNYKINLKLFWHLQLEPITL